MKSNKKQISKQDLSDKLKVIFCYQEFYKDSLYCLCSIKGANIVELLLK